MRMARNCLALAVEKAKSINDSGRTNRKPVEQGMPAVNPSSAHTTTK